MREFIKKLENNGLLTIVNEEVDVRQIQETLTGKRGPVYFRSIRGFKDYSVFGGIFTSRDAVAQVLNCSSRLIGQRFQDLTINPIKPVQTGEAPIKQNRLSGADVDLSGLPIPVMHAGDGGPYIAGGIVIADDPKGQFGTNLGMYRLMYRSKNETGIDLVTASDLRTFYERALELGQTLKVSIVIGASPALMMAATCKAPIGVSEYDIAGGLQGKAVRVTKSETSDIMVPAEAEILLEGEILPIGWVEQEGPFGEFAGFQGESKWNPILRFHSISYRDNPIYYSLVMPDENDWLLMASTEKQVYTSLRNAGINVHEVHVTPGAACFWHVIASIHKRAGEGKNAVLAALAVAAMKQAIITDADVDIFNYEEVERAMAFRMQPDRDVVIISGGRGNHVDPSLEAWTLPKGSLPVTSKIGFDATKPDSIPWKRYQRIKCYSWKKGLSQTSSCEDLKNAAKDILREYTEFTDFMDKLANYEYRDILRVWGALREEGCLIRDEEGRYKLSE